MHREEKSLNCLQVRADVSFFFPWPILHVHTHSVVPLPCRSWLQLRSPRLFRDWAAFSRHQSCQLSSAPPLASRLPCHQAPAASLVSASQPPPCSDYALFWRCYATCSNPLSQGLGLSKAELRPRALNRILRCQVTSHLIVIRRRPRSPPLPQLLPILVLTPPPPCAVSSYAAPSLRP